MCVPGLCHAFPERLSSLGFPHTQPAVLTVHTIHIAFFQVAEHIGQEVMDARAMLAQVLDFDLVSQDQLVAAGVCPQLDHLRETLQGLQDLLTQVSEAGG